MRWKTLLRTSAVTAATAVVGTLGTDPTSDWYRALDKPRWQPPPIAFPLVWTPLYVDLAVSTAQAFDRLAAEDRADEATRLRAALGTNLVLNAGWNWLFFTARRPRLATLECAVLAASSADLVRRVGSADRRAGIALAPYAVWCAFATALSGAIARRNRT